MIPVLTCVDHLAFDIEFWAMVDGTLVDIKIIIIDGVPIQQLLLQLD